MRIIPYSLFIGLLGSKELDDALRGVMDVEAAYKGNPLEVQNVIGKPWKKLIEVLKSELGAIKSEPQDPEDARFLKYVRSQVKNLDTYKSSIFWWSGLKWQLPLALDRIKAIGSQDTSRVIHRSLSLNTPGVNPKHMTKEKMEEYRKLFREQKGMLYLEDFFDDATFARMQQESKRLWMSPELEKNCNLDGKNRMGGYVLDPRTDNQNSFYNLIYANLDLGKFVSDLYEVPMYPTDFPIELREYGPKSTGMGCHQDVSLFADEKIDAEFLFTLFNNSTCSTTFNKLDGTEGAVYSKPNSLCFVRAGDGRHCVKCKPSNGHREVMKWIFSGTYKKSPYFSGYSKNQCGPSKNSKMMEKRRKERLAAEEGKEAKQEL